jgi:hypothetical protein
MPIDRAYSSPTDRAYSSPADVHIPLLSTVHISLLLTVHIPLLLTVHIFLLLTVLIPLLLTVHIPPPVTVHIARAFPLFHRRTISAMSTNVYYDIIPLLEFAHDNSGWEKIKEVGDFFQYSLPLLDAANSEATEITRFVQTVEEKPNRKKTDIISVARDFYESGGVRSVVCLRLVYMQSSEFKQREFARMLSLWPRYYRVAVCQMWDRVKLPDKFSSLLHLVIATCEQAKEVKGVLGKRKHPDSM